MKSEINENRYYLRLKHMFEESYEFSVCKPEEIEEVIDYIDKYWSKNHILVQSRYLLDWQHWDPIKRQYNFVIARSRKTKEIHAIEGFIPSSQFDSDIKTPITWGAIWKTRENVAPPGLGVTLKLYRENKFYTPFAGEIGISSSADKFNRGRGNKIFNLQPYYMQNPRKLTFSLLIPGDGVSARQNQTNIAVAQFCDKIGFESENMLDEKGIPPYKSRKYYVHRYFDHPIYSYEAFFLSCKNYTFKEVLFYRVAEAEGKKCIFIVDYIGLGVCLSQARQCLEELLVQNDAEYISFPSYGMSDEVLRSAGFLNRMETNAIVPLYFEPFSRKNVEIVCTAKNIESMPCSFKGDSDQDRPNYINQKRS